MLLALTLGGALLLVLWTARPREATLPEVQTALKQSSPESLRLWAVDFVQRHPECTNFPCSQRVTNGPLPAIRGVFPYASAFRTGPDDPLLLTVNWTRYGAQLLVGTTNFHPAASNVIVWTTGIYITPEKWL